MRHTLSIHDPGHFHAALLLSQPSHRVAPTVHVYAPPGPEVEKFIALIERFNQRAEAPTEWRLDCHIGPDSLEAMIAERPGDIVILAGRNGLRLPLMHRLHDEGFHILADKPWLTDGADLPHLEAITAGPPLAMDIMTDRHGALARLRNRVIATPSVFGALDGGGSLPALEFTSRHHLLKLVDGRPLQRPPWFYDANMQGDGLVDIQSHYVDQAQWIIAPEHHFQVDRDVEILAARRWHLPVPLELFQESTGEPAFPGYLDGAVADGRLNLACNGRIDYRLCGVWVRQHCEWGLREAVGGGDIHGFTARGERAELTVRTGPETGFQPRMHLSPHGDGNIEAALKQWRVDFPGLEAMATEGGYRLILPSGMEIAHEAQFPLMLDQFLDLVEADHWPHELAARIRARYTRRHKS